MRVAITGVAGYFGSVLLPLLESETRIDSVIGIDCVVPHQIDAFKKLEFHQLDIHNPMIVELNADVDILVHMAFVLMRRPGATDPDTVNIQGSRLVLEAGVEKSVKKIIFPSCVVGYGLHPDNPIPLTENSPLRPNEALYYSRAKAQVEAILDRIESEHPDITITRLRPCTVVGGRADRNHMETMLSPITALVKDYDPQFQILYETDLAQALLLAITDDLPGAYNVTPDEPKTLRQLAEARGGRVLEIPHPLIKVLFNILWRTKQTPFAPEWIDPSRYSLVASNDKLKSRGWQPGKTTQEAHKTLSEDFGVI